MSLDHYADARRQISRIQGRLNENVESLRRNTSLSPQGRRAEIAKATLDAQQSVDRFRNEVTTARQKRRDELARHLFGAATGDGGALAQRDAQDRVAKIETPEAGRAALRQAQLVGDISMTRALAQRAVDSPGWHDVANAYVDGLPPTESTAAALCLKELNDIPSGRNANLGDQAVFRIQMPAELGAVNTAVLERIARDAAPEAPQLLPSTAGWSR